MLLSASVTAVWDFASREAIAVRFPEIQPEHYLIALLKFADTPPDELLELIRNPVLTGHLAAEARLVQEELVGRGIDAHKVRRELRLALGDGRTPFVGDVMHRSAASRELFASAARLAANQGARIVTCRHLLDAVLEAPTPAITEVLGIAPTAGELGDDLTAVPLAGPVPLTPAAAALLQALAEKDRRCVILIADDSAAADQVVRAAAAAIIARRAEPGAADTRLIDVRRAVVAPGGDWAGKVFADAATRPGTVLFVPPLTATDPDWTARLAHLLTTTRSASVCHATPDAYRAVVEAEPRWKRLAHPLWLYAAPTADVPLEL